MIRALCLCLLAAPAAAQTTGFAATVPTAVVDPASVKACLADGGGPEAGCIGAAAELCMERTEGGFSTAGMSECTGAETGVWDRLLNETYRSLRADLDGADARDKPSGGQGIDRSDALRDAQRAWIAYRDAECRLRWAQFQDGTIRSTIAAGCHLDFTARRAFELRDMGRMEDQ